MYKALEQDLKNYRFYSVVILITIKKQKPHWLFILLNDFEEGLITDTKYSKLKEKNKIFVMLFIRKMKSILLLSNFAPFS